jgi:hypothetical protein
VNQVILEHPSDQAVANTRRIATIVGALGTLIGLTCCGAYIRCLRDTYDDDETGTEDEGIEISNAINMNRTQTEGVLGLDKQVNPMWSNANIPGNGAVQ